MEETKYTTHSAEETRLLGAETARKTNPGSVIALQGDLGAGKTTFVQGFLEALGADGSYVSPTFVIMKQYDVPESTINGIRRIYHVDAYRIDDPEDIARLGFAEWCADEQGIVLVEWPERIASIVPASATNVSLRWISDTDREIAIEG
jgi:tRNA threonylcarbamoyladenosine biosynthesis protein TsaE